MKKAETLVSLVDNSAEKFPKRIAITSEITGEQYTYPQLRENSLRISNALLQRGIGKGDYIAVISDNIPEFIFADYGILYTGAASVPINQNLKPENLLEDYLRFVKPKVILAEGKYTEKVRRYSNGTPIISLEEALKAEPKRPDVEISQDDIAAIIFSSGTSSETERAFKAIQLSHENLASNIISNEDLIIRAEKRDGVSQGVYITGLVRQWHSFEYMVQKAFLYGGALLDFTNIQRFQKGNSGAQINPHYMLMVPKFANVLMNEIKEQIKNKSEKTYKLFNWFLENSNQYNYEWVNNGKFDSKKWLLHQVAEQLFYKKIRKELEKKFGKNLLYMVGGSAPLPLETQMFFESIGMPIYQGYGLTETSPVVSVNTPEKKRFGSSGKPIEGVDVMIAEQESTKNRKIRITEEGKEGLILTKGPNVFKGYLNDEAATLKSFIGGWFNTGDLGFMKEGYLYVTGREDYICKLNGEKTNPSRIETHYSARGLDILLVGNKQNNDGAFIIADSKMKKRLKEGLQEKELISEVCNNQLADSKQKFGINFSPRNVAIITDLDEHPELTTGTLKVRRKLVEKHYASLIKQICN